MFRNALSILKNLLLLLAVLVPAVPIILILFAILLGIVAVTLVPAVWRNPPTTAILIIGFSGFFLLFVLLLAFGKVPIIYNLRNLVVRWKTTLMTALSFTLVVTLLTVMLAFVNGLYQITGNAAVPGNIVLLSDGAIDESMSNLGNASSSNPIYFLNEDQKQYVARDSRDRPLVSLEAYMVAGQSIPATAGTRRPSYLLRLLGIKPSPPRRRRFLMIRGLTDPAMTAQVHGLRLKDGGAWFSEAGVQPLGKNQDGTEMPEQAIQAVLGAGMAREMGNDVYKRPLEPGDFFDVGQRKWVVTGVLDSAGSTFDSEVWIKMQIAGPMFGKENWTTCILRTTVPESSKEIADALTKEVKSPKILAQTEEDYYSKLNKTNQQFLWAIVVVTSILAVGSIFGIMNTMFAAISQRTKDIAMMRIVGFTRFQMLASFFLESLFIAAIGGLLGCALGYLANGWTASSMVSSGMGGRSVVLKLIVDGPLLASGMLFTLTMGALGGLLPALSAMRLRPLESLR
jgi:ABC-type lipoprotein release transport system permease subunit